MDFFPTDYENESTKQEINDLVDECAKYDVYDIISRVAGLNLMSQNQNKAVLMDSLIQYILARKGDYYRSSVLASDKKFSSMLEKMNNITLSRYIDPCENVFVQKVFFAGSEYRVFNGIDVTPAYNLQALIKILFQQQNNFDSAFISKVKALLFLLLSISEDVVRKLHIDKNAFIYDENKRVIIPKGEEVRRYSEMVKIRTDFFYSFADGCFDVKELLSEFGTEETGEINNRPFYCCPFLKCEEKGYIIVLNFALLPAYAFYKAMEWAKEYSLEKELFNTYNDYIWSDTKRTLANMGHRKVNEKVYGVECLETNYCKESIFTVYNNQLLLTFFICDDGNKYSQSEMHGYYPSSKHMDLVRERISYYEDNFDKLETSKDDIFILFVLNSIGRAIQIWFPKDFMTICLNPFELQCISINEEKNRAFLPRYMRAKSHTKSSMPVIISELNTIEIYRSNNYSFYVDDDIDIEEVELIIPPGDSIKYISDALDKEGSRLLDSYINGYCTEVKQIDKIRNIYIENAPLHKDYIAYCVAHNNVSIWVKTAKIKKEEEFNIYYSLVSAIAYWLGECKQIVEMYSFPFATYVIHIGLDGTIDDFFIRNKEITPYEECIDLEIEKNEIFLTVESPAYTNLQQEFNYQEKEFCRFILDIFDDISLENKNYYGILDSIFANPLKKRFYVAEMTKKPYLKPIDFKSYRRVHEEDEDYIAGMVGRKLIESGEWKIGRVDDSDRMKVANEVVSILFERLQEMVSKFEATNILELMYHDIEEITLSIDSAQENYYADVVCYPESEKRYIEEFNSLTKTSMALKFLIEYATARPANGVKHFGYGQYEELLAICAMIINWAYKGDLFYYGIVNTPVEILKSKRIGMRQEPFYDMYLYSNQVREKQLKYDSSSSLRRKYSNEIGNSDENIESAFEAEFGYSYSEFVQVITTMIGINDKDVICISQHELGKRLIEENEALTETLINKVLEDIVYQERDNFLVLPKGFEKEDAYPWRFNRKYSFNRRPVLRRGEDLIWGNRALYHMTEFVIDLIYSGKFRANSSELKSLCGTITKSIGAAFNKRIFDMISDMHEFKVYPNVKKINGKRIALAGLDLGDIDLLIIDDVTDRILVTEVKNFKFSRNPREIRLEYDKMFNDKDKISFASKHQRREQWIKEHIDDVRTEYNLDNRNWIVSGLFIVNQPLISQHIYKRNINCLSEAELSVDAIRNL